jgi:hypothetical protein
MPINRAAHMEVSLAECVRKETSFRKGYWITSKTSFAVPPNVRNLSKIGFTRID